MFKNINDIADHIATFGNIKDSGCTPQAIIIIQQEVLKPNKISKFRFFINSSSLTEYNLMLPYIATGNKNKSIEPAATADAKFETILFSLQNFCQKKPL